MATIHTTFAVLPGKPLQVQTGWYDTKRHHWNVETTRDAVASDLPFLKNPERFLSPTANVPSYSCDGLRTPILPNMKNVTPKPVLSGSHNGHARLAPSSAKQWSNCTASISFIEANADRLPKDDSSVYSDEGTEAHDWAAKLLTGQITRAELPEAFAEHVMSYADHCNSLVPEGVAPQIEASVPLWYQQDQNGTVDFAVVTEERVTIRDLKYGAGVLVSAQENPQLAIYAFSLVHMLEDVYEFTSDTIIDIGIFQPRHREADSAEPWILTLKELSQFCEEIETAVIKIRENRDVVFAPSEGDDGACRWCKAKGLCQARMEAAAEGLTNPEASGMDMIAMMPELTKEEKKLPVAERLEARFEKMGINVGTLTDNYLVRMFAASKWIMSCFEDVAELLEARALAGDIPEGTKLVMGRPGNRAWRNEVDADTFLKGQGMKQDERYDYKLKSPTKIEEILAPKLKTVKRTATRFAELIERSEPRKVLALLSDKREAVSAAIEGFSDETPVAEEYDV